MVGGGLLTSIGDWYRQLSKPSWQPPDWLFGPAWTIILGLAAWAFVLVWNDTTTEAERLLLLALYVVNFLCHFLWSPLFFKLQREAALHRRRFCAGGKPALSGWCGQHLKGATRPVTKPVAMLLTWFRKVREKAELALG